MLSQRQLGFLQSGRVLRLASFSKKRHSHNVPLCYACEGENIYIPSVFPEGRKVKNVRETRRVAILIDDYFEEDAWKDCKALMIQGQASLLKGGEEFSQARTLVYEKYPEYEAVYPLKEGSQVIIKVTPYNAASWGVDPKRDIF